MSDKTKNKFEIFIPADLDQGTLEGFYDDLENLLKESPEEIELNSSLLDHVTSNHISTLWTVYNRCEQAGVRIHLTSVKYGLERILRLLDLYDLFVVQKVDEEQKLELLSPPALQLKLKATVDDINDALHKFRDFLMRLDPSEICAFDLETVFYEVMTNIRLHGQHKKNDSVVFTAIPSKEKISLRFVDPGPSFDPTCQTSAFDPKEAIHKKQKNGFGLIIIKRMVDTISYKRVDDRLNVLTLEKKLKRKGETER